MGADRNGNRCASDGIGGSRFAVPSVELDGDACVGATSCRPDPERDRSVRTDSVATSDQIGELQTVACRRARGPAITEPQIRAAPGDRLHAGRVPVEEEHAH